MKTPKKATTKKHYVTAKVRERVLLRAIGTTDAAAARVALEASTKKPAAPPLETMEQLVKRGTMLPFHRLDDAELADLGRLLLKLGSLAYKFNALDLGALLFLEQRRRHAEAP